MLMAQLYLKYSLFHKMKCPSWTRVKRQKRSSGRTENGKGAKNTHFCESFVRQESCRPVTTFELAVIQWIYLFQKSTVANAITCNEIKTSFPHHKTNVCFFLLFVKSRHFKSVTNLFYGYVKCFPSSCGFRHSVCFSIYNLVICLSHSVFSKVLLAVFIQQGTIIYFRAKAWHHRTRFVSVFRRRSLPPIFPRGVGTATRRLFVIDWNLAR